MTVHHVEYLLIGGYAVGHYGYVRSTVDMDIWIAVTPVTAERMVKVLKEFGFGGGELVPELFLKVDQILRLGVPPLRLEIHTSISGVDFQEAYTRRMSAQMDGVDVTLISLDDLKTNKSATGRTKDKVDLEHLP
ncbi:MAG: hypothetical protein KDA75_20550 [Planctomycetaceae bacterium]|nr:hypothetical protein [Planctomycetaceae bacterium]